jgi:hypothetical protein
MLPKLEGYAASLLESLDATALATVVREFTSLEQTVLSRSDLRAVLSDTSIPGVARGLVLADLLEGKVHPTTLRLAVFAATNVPAQEVDHSIAELSVVARILESTGSFCSPRAGASGASRTRCSTR